ncbi:hypothetical protein BD289DRAFT_216427 [Coniella lustricola]|uniref:Uncharacterized protein n=1 Tax=Coniella lustricola TaxID=2025994 RepID=A0A2T3ABB6_9PEZI|nr:hypothetical protein BD289DRAFT_216427 [Coniella lustricola]
MLLRQSNVKSMCRLGKVDSEKRETPKQVADCCMLFRDSWMWYFQFDQIKTKMVKEEKSRLLFKEVRVDNGRRVDGAPGTKALINKIRTTKERSSKTHWKSLVWYRRKNGVDPKERRLERACEGEYDQGRGADVVQVRRCRGRQ